MISLGKRQSKGSEPIFDSGAGRQGLPVTPSAGRRALAVR